MGAPRSASSSEETQVKQLPRMAMRCINRGHSRPRRAVGNSPPLPSVLSMEERPPLPLGSRCTPVCGQARVPLRYDLRRATAFGGFPALPFVLAVTECCLQINARSIGWRGGLKCSVSTGRGWRPWLRCPRAGQTPLPTHFSNGMEILHLLLAEATGRGPKSRGTCAVQGLSCPVHGVGCPCHPVVLALGTE